MPATKLKEFLDSHGARYVRIEHSPAFTAQEVAHSAHVTTSNFAKTVIIRNQGDLAMVVLPATRKIVLSDLREMLLHDDIKLATEAEFQARFPDCELGAMPPFGNLYGLPVYVAGVLADEEEIAFNAGNHHEVIKMRFEEYADLVRPIIIDFVTT